MSTLVATAISQSTLPSVYVGDTLTQTDINTGYQTLRTAVNNIITDLTTLNTDKLEQLGAYTLGATAFNSTISVASAATFTTSISVGTTLTVTGASALNGNTTFGSSLTLDFGANRLRNIGAATTSTDAIQYQQAGKLATTNTWTLVNTFNELPTLDSYETPTADAQFAPKKYVDDQTASLVTGGIIQQTSAPAVTAGNLWVDTTNTSGYRLHRANGTIFGPVAGYHIGTSAPTQPTPAAGHTWLDTTNSTYPTFKYYDGSTWRQVQPTTATGSITFSAGFSVASSQTIDFNSNVLTEVGTPVATTDAVNKAYADALTPKIFVSTASAGPNSTVTETTLFGAGVGSLTIAGNTLAVGSVINIRIQGECDAHSTSDVQVFKVKMGAITLTTFTMTPVNGDDNSLENNIGLDFAYISGGAVTNLTPVSPGTANLLAYWTLDDVGSPTTWLDSVGTYNLTNSGTVSSNALGNVGGAAHFDDNRSDFLFNNSFSNTFHGSDFTVGGWVYMDGSGDDTIVAAQYAGSAGSGKRHWHLITGTDNVPQFAMYNTLQVPFIVRADAAISALQWYHLCAVKNSNVMTLYVNGAAQTTTATFSGSAQTSAQALNLGRYFDATYFDGKLDEVFVYTRALTIEEIGFFVAGNSYTDL